jgi:hypothetical protein
MTEEFLYINSCHLSPVSVEYLRLHMDLPQGIVYTMQQTNGEAYDFWITLTDDVDTEEVEMPEDLWRILILAAHSLHLHYIRIGPDGYISSLLKVFTENE